MTGPASIGIERGTGAPSRSTGTQGAVGAVLMVLALGLALRLIIAQLLPGSGFGVDLSAFRFWADDLATNGPAGFYQRDFFHDYTPGYLYVLWLVGTVGHAMGGIGDLIKVPAILADMAIGWLVWSMVLELGGRRSLALAAAFVAVLNPVTWFDSVVWGQVDSVGVVFLLLGLRDVWRDRPERAAVFTVIAALIKPQLGILVPILAVVTIRRALWPVTASAGGSAESNAREATFDAPGLGTLERLRAWERRTGRPIRVLTTGLAGIATIYLMCLPFGLSVLELSSTPPYVTSGLLDQILSTASGYPYVTVNGFNPWALVIGDTGNSVANSGLWVCDGAWGAARCGSGIAVFGTVPAVAVGIALLVSVILVILVVVARRPDRLTILLGLTVLAFAFFVVPTRVHERYGFPFFALAIILAAISWRWRIAYLFASVATFLNMYVVLTTLYTDNPGVADWLGIGPAIRAETGVALIALANGAIFLWIFAQLRSGARARLAADLEAAGELPEPEEPGFPQPVAAPGEPSPLTGEPRPGTGGPPPGAFPAVITPAVVTMPTWSVRPSIEEAGIRGWFRGLLDARPYRPDRSLILGRERGGRLDRLDLWFLVVLVVATLGMRTFRLAEPYQMHFDEVYHARTATEFLQGWRYGLSHDIYEWTHPHLAKYAMAGGLVLWGQDGVSATSDLGVPVVASVIEPRRDDPLEGGRAGERLHVATGTEIRTYDLRTRALIGVIAAPRVTALTMSGTGTELIVGYDDGRLGTVDVEAMGADGADAGPSPVDLGAGVGSRVDLLLATSDGATLMVGSGEHLSTVDIDTGAVTGSLDLPLLVDLASGGTGSALVATPSAVDDPATVATTLADLIGGDAGELEAKLREPGETVVLGSPGDAATRTKVEAAIADGSLAGIEITEVGRVAAATADGVTFVDPATASIIETIQEAGGAHGLALVKVDDPKIYATVGPADKPEYDVIAVGGDQAKDGPASIGRHPLPGSGTRVIYDPASQQVHVLGLAPDAPAASAAGPWTVYVIEPHGNSVYADARLPDGFRPITWAADLEPEYPAEDRQQLLLFTDAGASASVDVGSHAFAWRLPGVIAGAITAALLYLLTRILFRRRFVAGLVAVLVLADGMFFVQSRIAMNDVYVGLFIAAAYTVFAAIWTGWWKGRWAFWLAMPTLGVLLGLALASKWVAAYAIGALVLLILVRSALGRVVAVLAMIGITTVLGYMAISVPEGAQGFGNLTFLLIMIGLTLTGVVAAILHPIAWTDDEMRFAVAAPMALGMVVFLGAVASGSANQSVNVGSLAITPVEAALALALGSGGVALLFWLGGRLGFGPLALPPAPGDPGSHLEPPAAAPDGWLRPGWLLGLPVVYAAICLVALPLALYVVSYIPWAMIEGHQIVAGWPAGHNGQTLPDLTAQMYRYHNGLTAAHAASSPWWAWPFDFKPVWFYQEGLGAGTSAALYDAGSLVIWWLGIPALAFVSLMAFKRRSLALTLIAVGFAAQWVPWARIDRAAFQYHYYTALPFLVLALAYWMAEMWHGASRRTWQLARLAAALAIMGPALLWLFHRPLCALVGVGSVNPGSAACPAVIPTAVLTIRTLGLIVVVGVGLLLLIRQFVRLDAVDGPQDGRRWRSFLPLALTGAGVAVGLVVVALLPDTPIVTLTDVPVEPIALIVLIPLSYLAVQIVGSRDSRRFVVGFAVAAVSWFAILYPNISALPLPSAVVAAYQGILPTYLYAFQFPVSTVDRSQPTALLTPMFAILLVAVVVTCLVVAYSTWSWRLSLADPTPSSSDEADEADEAETLGRTGGG